MGPRMTDRCRIGDIAIIIKDEVGCEANIGRIVLVMGLRRVLSTRGTIWRIQPVNGTTITYLDDTTCAIVVGRAIGIDHADAWLLPIRPQDCDEAIGAALELSIPRVLEVV